jgi:hypothetical protein
MLHRHRLTATAWTSWADDTGYHVHTYPSPLRSGIDLTTESSAGPAPHAHAYLGAFAGPEQTGTSFYDRRPDHPEARVLDGRGAEAVLVDVARERVRAHAKHEPDSMEVRPWGDGSWLPVLTEELGEVARCLNDSRHHGVLAVSDRLRADLYSELIQLAAMAAAWAHAVQQGDPVPALLAARMDGPT